MTKATSTPSKIKVQTRIGNLSFRQVSDRRFIVRCKGQARIRISQNKSGQWEGVSVPAHANKHGVELVTLGATPERCYRRSVTAFWATE